MAKQVRSVRKIKARHRAHKRDSIALPTPPEGNHRARRTREREDAREVARLKREAHEVLMAKQAADKAEREAAARQEAEAAADEEAGGVVPADAGKPYSTFVESCTDGTTVTGEFVGPAQ